MTIDEVIKDLQKGIKASSIGTKEELIAALEKHFSIIAVKAEMIGEARLMEMCDTVKELLPKILSGKASEEDTDKLFHILGIIRTRCENYQEERDLLKGDIHNACEEYDRQSLYLRELKDYVCKLENEYRKKYNEPSGIVNLSFLSDE